MIYKQNIKFYECIKPTEFHSEGEIYVCTDDCHPDERYYKEIIPIIQTEVKIGTEVTVTEEQILSLIDRCNGMRMPQVKETFIKELFK